MNRLVRTSGSTPPHLLSLEQVKAHCRCQNSAEDSLFNAWIIAAEKYVEDYTRRCLLTSSYRLLLECFPYSDRLLGEAQRHYVPYYRETARTLRDLGIDLLVSPVQSITSFTYYDTAGTLQTFTSSDYQLQTSEIAPKVFPAPGSTWPGTQAGKISAVTIDFVAGYTAADQVPAQFTQAMLLIIGDWYANRENAGIKVECMAADRLLEKVMSERY